MNVLGLDPGSWKCGYGVVTRERKDFRVIDAGLFRMTKKASLSERLGQLIHDLDEVAKEHAIDGVCIENLFVHPQHPQSSLVLAQARGAVLGYLASRELIGQRSLSLYEPSPASVKKWLTGNGQATKEEMARAVQIACRLHTVPKPFDVTDAIAIGLVGWQHLWANRVAADACQVSMSAEGD